MEVELRVVQGAFADEEIAACDLAWEAIEPTRVSGVGDPFLSEPDPVALWIGFGLVFCREGLNLSRTSGDRLVGMNLAKVDRERPLWILEIVAHGSCQRVDTGLDFARADDLDRMASRVGVEGGVEESRDPAEMVPVKMGDQDHVDLVARNAELRETCIRCGTAIEEHAATITAGKNRGLPPPARAECVARSDEDEFTQWAISAALSDEVGRQF